MDIKQARETNPELCDAVLRLVLLHGQYGVVSFDDRETMTSLYECARRAPREFCITHYLFDFLPEDKEGYKSMASPLGEFLRKIAFVFDTLQFAVNRYTA